MNHTYALINDGVVVNTIIAPSSFLSNIEEQYDAIIEIDSLDPMPGIGWLHDGELFTNPQSIVEEEP